MNDGSARALTLPTGRLTQSQAGIVTYGTCCTRGTWWLIECEPHVMIRLKRWFARVDPMQRGQVKVRRSPEVDADLQCFLDRFPLEMTDEDVADLHRGAETFRRQGRLVRKVLGGDYQPRDFQLAVKLRDYQRIAADLARQLKCLLIGDDTGLGKTLEATAWFSDPALRPVLVVTPGGAVPNQWKGQIERFLPGVWVHILRASKPYDYVGIAKRELRAEGRTAPGPFPDAFVSPYTRMHGHIDSLGPKLKALVFDECKSLRHGDETGKYKAAMAYRKQVQHCIGLDATPCVNWGGEAFNVLDVISPGSLGSREEFVRDWCIPHSEDRKLIIADPPAFGFYLKESGLLLRRTRREVGRELPPVTMIPHHIEADLEKLDEVKDRASALARTILDQTMGKGAGFLKLRAGGDLDRLVRQMTGIAKAPYIAEFLRMLVETGESVCCALWHRSVYDIIGTRLKDLRPAFYTGAESTPQKVENLRRFTSGETKVLLMSLRAGEALDGLQYVCRTPVIGELDWSHVIHHQFISRFDRDGQPDKVMAYTLLADVGSDPIVADVCGAKHANYEPVRNPDPKMLAQVNVDPAHIRKLAESYLAQRGGRR